MLLNDSNVWSEVSGEGFSYRLHQDMMSLWCSFHLLLWNAGHQIGRWNMTGCDIAVECKILGSLGPLTQFRYLSCHFSKVIKTAIPLPVTDYIRSLDAKKKKKTLMHVLISFQSHSMLPSVLNICREPCQQNIPVVAFRKTERDSGKKKRRLRN